MEYLAVRKALAKIQCCTVLTQRSVERDVVNIESDGKLWSHLTERNCELVGDCLHRHTSLRRDDHHTPDVNIFHISLIKV